MTDELGEFLKIMNDGYWDCPCGNRIEPDGHCYCGRNSPLIDAGLI